MFSTLVMVLVSQIHMSRFIRIYTLNLCSFLWISYTSVNAKKKKKRNLQKFTVLTSFKSSWNHFQVQWHYIHIAMPPSPLCIHRTLLILWNRNSVLLNNKSLFLTIPQLQAITILLSVSVNLMLPHYVLCIQDHTVFVHLWLF